MGTDEVTPDETDEPTDEVGTDEVEGHAMGLPSVGFGITPPGLGTSDIHTRKAGEHPQEYLKVDLEETFITRVD